MDHDLDHHQDNETILFEIESKFQCRRRSIRQLAHHFCLGIAENIVITGPRATGKTSITRELAKKLKLFHVWYDCINLDTERSFYEKILSLIDDDDDDVKCLNQLQFLDRLTLSLDKSKNRRLFLILDNAELMINQDNETLIYLLNNLNKLLSGLPVTVVWICRYQLERLFRISTEFKMSALEITFPSYTEEELFTLLMKPELAPPIEDPHRMYKSFVSLVLRTLIPFENNFVNLKFICHRYFNRYVKPIEDDEISFNKAAQLCLRFRPTLQEIIDQIGGDSAGAGFSTNLSIFVRQMSPGLCYAYASVYLATYNSPKTDIRFLVRNQRKTKNRKSLHSSSKDMIGEKCPKWFELERSYHIYRALIDLNEKNSDIRNFLLTQDHHFHRHLSDMFDQKILLGKSGGWSCSGDSKYQLSQAITDRIINRICQSIDLNLNAFLCHPIEQQKIGATIQG